MTSYFTGNSGGSTGPHLDFRVWSVNDGAFVDPRPHTSILTSDGNSVADTYEVTSPYGMRTHPIHGDQRMHHGIDYATPAGTAINVNGEFLTTYNDPGGGGVTSQYAFIGADGNPYEAILMHGSGDNPILSDSYRTDGSPQVSPSSDNPTILASRTPAPEGEDTFFDRQSAKERVKTFQNMSKSDMNSSYDKMRGADPVKAGKRGLEMHRALFKK